MIAKYYQTLKNGSKVLDFHKIAAEGHRINIIMSERGAQGKTFNVKEYALDQYLKKGHKTLWILNAQDQIEKSIVKFTVDNAKVNKKWDDFAVDSHGVYLLNKKNNSHRLRDNREYFLYFSAIINAGKHKNSRDSDVKILVYDEFNEYINTVWNIQHIQFDSLLHSYSVPQADNEETQIFMFGNQKGVAVPILQKLGFDKITGEETIKKYSSIFTSWMYVPTKNKIEMEKIEKHWMYQFSKILGLADQSFLNKPREENLDGIVEIPKDEDRDSWLSDRDFKFKQTYIFNYQTYHLFKSNAFNMYYFVNTDKLKKPVMFINVEDREFGLLHDKLFHEKITLLLAAKQVIFDSIFTKYTIVKSMKSMY